MINLPLPEGEGSGSNGHCDGRGWDVGFWIVSILRCIKSSNSPPFHCNQFRLEARHRKGYQCNFWQKYACHDRKRYSLLRSDRALCSTG